MMEGSEALLRGAREVRAHAHAPYSGFQVGAALMAADGSIHVGGNVENASYGLTLCAERVALGTAISRGHRQFRMLALSTSSGPPVPPCGACLQALAEFSPNLPVISEALGAIGRWTLRELLPEAFTIRSSAAEPGNSSGPTEGSVDR
jgi:cytidine deaminase